MAYTFGAGVTDRVTWSGQSDIGQGATTVLVMGWWLPTTLTATRVLWGTDDVTGVAVDTTTSELRMTNQSFSGTNGVYTTTGAGLTTGTWSFVATMLSVGNAPTSQWRVWVGSATTPPAEVTINTVTAITTNLSGSLGAFTIGNHSASSLAFQGAIDNVYFMWGSSTPNVFDVATLGTISAAEADLALQRFILPFWRGGLPVDQLAGTYIANHWDGGVGAPARQAYRGSVSGTGEPIAPTYTGVTVSAEQCPRPVVGRHIGHPALV